MMKLLSTLMFLLSFNAFSQVQVIHLSSQDEVRINCPKSSTPQLKDNVVKCGCAGDKVAYLVEGVLTCESKCTIAVETMTEPTWCDQGGCGGVSSYEAVTVKKEGQTIYSQKIYSTISRELEFILPEAIAVAKKACFKTFYKNKEI